MTDLDTIMGVEGLLGQEEAALLFNRARHASLGIVEIGSYRGRSTVALALGSKAGNSVPVVAIDPHETTNDGLTIGPADRAALLSNLVRAGVGDLVRVVGLRSSQAWACWQDGEIDLLWIDGDHDAVESDFGMWMRHVAKGGFVLLHDRHLPQVERVAERAQNSAWNFTRLENVGGILQLMKETR